MGATRAPEDDDAELLKLSECGGLAGKCNRENQRRRLIFPWMRGIGMCPSASGALSPLSQICSYQTRNVLESMVELYRWRLFRWCRIKRAQVTKGKVKNFLVITIRRDETPRRLNIEWDSIREIPIDIRIRRYRTEDEAAFDASPHIARVRN